MSTTGRQPEEVHLVKQESSTEPTIGFNITINNLETQGAGFDGTLTRNGISLPWKGSFVAFRNSPLSVIRAGLQPIDTDVQAFLDLTPLITISGQNEALDQVEKWSASIYQEV